MTFTEPNDANVWLACVQAALQGRSDARNAIEVADQTVEAFRARMPSKAERAGSGLVVPAMAVPRGQR